MMARSLALDTEFPWLLQQFVVAYSSGPSRALLRSFEADLLSHAQVEDPVLDLACGDGLVSALTFRRPLDEGCDLSERQLAKARERKQYRTLTLADARALPHSEASFATVISNSSMEHIPQVDQVISEVARVLRPEGRFVFTVPGPRFNEWFWIAWLCSRLGLPERGQQFVGNFNVLREHHNVLDREGWGRLLESAGFTDVKVAEYLSFPNTFVFSLLEHLWTVNPVLPVPYRWGMRRKRINIAGAMLRILPARLRCEIQVHPLLWLQRLGRDARGSHLLITATKPAAQ